MIRVMFSRSSVDRKSREKRSTATSFATDLLAATESKVTVAPTPRNTSACSEMLCDARMGAPSNAVKNALVGVLPALNSASRTAAALERSMTSVT